jgi:PilZ domain-containing protein
VSDPIVTALANLQLPVEVIGSDLYGQQFFESTHTVTIHRNGVSLLLENKVAPDCELILRNPQTNEEAIAFVVGQAREDSSGHVYGLAFVDSAVNLWHVQFPGSEAARTIQLECAGCHSVCTLTLSDIELEVFRATQELTRSCENCNASETWREIRQEPAAKQSGPSPAQDPNPTVAASPIEERRKNRRMAMKKSACVRYSGVEVVVACEDISKGGFRFTSHKEYPQGTRVEAAVPYTKSSNNIFTLAGIIYCQKMPDGQYRHGVTYVKNRGSIGWDP